MRYVLVVAVSVVMTAAACSPPPASPPESEADRYVSDYGGSHAVYDRILGLSDCGALQGEFDIAAANNDAADPGTPQHRQTTGYMAAADARMQAIGCY